MDGRSWCGYPLQVLGDFLEFIERAARTGPAFADGCVEAVVDVIVDQLLLGVGNRVLHGVELLGELQARPMLLDHRDGAAEVSVGTAKPLDDFRVG